MPLEQLKLGDRRKAGLVSDWEKWLEEADGLYNKLLHRAGYSPFYHHEVSSVGLLASAAALAGFLPMMEYEIRKKKRIDMRRKGEGRADLWFDSGPRCYSFEAKRAYVAATTSNLSAMLHEAHADAWCIDKREYHYAAGLLIAYVYEPKRTATYLAFANSDFVDLAYRIGPNGEDGAYLFFKLV
ncbi:MAG: hypothetical protein AAF687_09310 [Pseudomonadota bacterium]